VVGAKGLVKLVVKGAVVVVRWGVVKEEGGLVGDGDGSITTCRTPVSLLVYLDVSQSTILPFLAPEMPHTYLYRVVLIFPFLPLMSTNQQAHHVH